MKKADESVRGGVKVMERELEDFRSSMLAILMSPKNVVKGMSFMDCPLGDLVSGLSKELVELKGACRAKGPDDIMDEALDVANMAFLIWTRIKKLDDADLRHTPECMNCPACLLERDLDDAGHDMISAAIRAEADAKRKGDLEKPNIVWDLDGVLAEHAWPEVGKPIPWAIEAFKEYQRAGHLCIIYTARDTWHLRQIRAFCVGAGIIPDQIVCGKPLGVLVDDLALNPDEMVWPPAVETPIYILCKKVQRLWTGNLEEDSG